MEKAPAFLLALVLIFSLFLNPAFAQSVEKGPYINEVRFIHYLDENIALGEIKAGNLDAYYFRMPVELISDVQNDPKIAVYEKYAGSVGLLLNPAEPKDENSFNMFEFKEVRYAMNYLINREFVVNEILNGYGTPMIDPFGIYSPEYLNIIDIVESFGFRYNPGLAENIISEALTNAGAIKEDSKWTYKGNPVTVKILIRSDDPVRKSIGEVLSSELEEIGVTVQKEFGDLSKANPVVYGSNPQDFQWHIYTEGFAGTSVFVKYNPVITAQMYGPWYGSLPGGQRPDFWNYKNETIDTITQKILFSNFTSEQERNELVRMATKAGIQESVRLFIAQKIEAFVASSSLNGLVNDFGAGIASKYSLINVRPEGSNSVDIGVKQIHQGAWNGVGGLQDVYNRDILFAIADSATFRHPYTGEIITMRNEWTEISTEGPFGVLEVAPDAQLWDPVSEQWVEVGTNSTAMSKVTYKILYSDWHHGIPMDKSDLLYSQYFGFEWGTDEGEGDLTVDSEYTSQVQVALPLLKGIKFISEDEVESYVDLWHYDDKEIADFATVWTAEPWEISAAGERLVTSGKLAYSRVEANAKGIDQLDLVVSGQAEMIKAELQKMKSENFVPAALKGIVSADDAKKRYDASIKWINDHGHAVVSNGPFYLDEYNIAGSVITIKAFKDESYPFEVGHWSEFKNPKLATLEKIEVAKSITIGQPSEIRVNVNVDGQPSSDALVNYIISNKDGLVVVQGEAQPAPETGVFEIALSANQTAKLSTGPNVLKIFAYGKEAVRPDISTSTILATSGAASTGGNQTTSVNGTAPESTPSGCLIATAAFGSELSPQVQYLRNFREHYILSTTSGSAFMNAFNSIYYSFSPQVADYERDRPWLKETVKSALYPLFGILGLAERTHFAAQGGEIGSIMAGGTASILIGAVYLSPFAALAHPVLKRRFGAAVMVSLVLLIATMAVMAAGIFWNSQFALVASTSLFVLTLAGISAIASANVIAGLISRARRHQGSTKGLMPKRQHAAEF